MSRTSNPALGIRFVLVAMVAFAVQDGTSKYLAAEYPPRNSGEPGRRVHP